MIPPPEDVAPERLFRLLLPLRPIAAIDYRIRCAPDVPLLVRALNTAEEAEALDRAADGPEELRSSRAELEVLARCLWTPSGPAFDGTDLLGRLDEAEVSTLAREAATVLNRIAPVYGRADLDKWKLTLERGARHVSNISTILAMGECWAPVPLTKARMPHPDRYWGVPVRGLLDGHWMAFRAAEAALASGPVQGNNCEWPSCRASLRGPAGKACPTPHLHSQKTA